MIAPLTVFQRFLPAHLQHAIRDGLALLDRPLRDRAPGAVLFFDISGFTPLCERFTRRGPAGIEALTLILNGYFGVLVETMLDHGGDVVSFGGDAMIAMWRSDDLEDAILRAGQCGLALQRRMAETAAVAVEKLALKVAIDAGEVLFACAGGVRDRWETFVSGEALRRICHPDLPLSPGLVLLSPEAAGRVRERVTTEALPSGWVHLSAIRGAPEPRPLPEVQIAPEMGDAVKAFVPAAIRRRLEAGQGDWLAELRQVTVLFINLPEAGDATDPEESQACLVAIQNAIYRFEGSVYQFAVDDKGLTAVAAFGLPPLAHEDDPLRGALAALAARDALSAMGATCRVGLATGRVFSGIIGTERRRLYTLIGDCMNLAARLMERAQNDVFCDAATHAAVGSRMELEQLPAVSLRGKSGAFDLFRPIRRRDAVSLAPPSEMIGRFEERRVLEEKLRALHDQKTGGLVVIEGEAGIGKSRLVQELLVQVRRARVEALVGAADAIEKNTAWFPWRSIVTALVGIAGDRNAGALERALREHGVAAEDQAFAPLFNALVGAEIPETEITAQMTGEARGDTTHRLVVALLRARAAAAPLVVILEDAHWFDSASWKLLQIVAREVEPLLLIVSTRTLGDTPGDSDHAVLRGKTVTRVLLEGLPPGENLQLAARHLGVDALPTAVADLIRERGGGNPFYNEVLINELLERRAIAVEHGRCEVLVPDLPALSVPNTLEGLITTRIDRVPPSLQLTLKVASVIGRVFEQETVSGIFPVADELPSLASYLARLDSLGFALQETPPPNARYLFKHVITRDVAYNLMLFAQRRDLHHALGEWIEARHADDPQVLPLLAHHFTMGDDKPRAITYLVKAAEQALGSYANREVLTFLDEVARLETEGGGAPSTEDAIRRAEIRAEALTRLGRYGDAIVHFETALRLLASPVVEGGLPAVGRLLREILAHVLRRARKPVPALTEGREKLLRAAAIRNELVKLYFFAGRVLPGLHSMIRQLNEADAVGPSPELASALATAGAFFSVLGMPGVGRFYNTGAERLMGQIDHIATRGYVTHVLCFQYLFAADWTGARRMLDASVAQYGRLGATHTEAALHPQINLGVLDCYTGRLREATTALERLAVVAARSAAAVTEIQAHTFLAEVLLRRGRWAEAIDHAERAGKLIGAQQFPAEKLTALSVLARANQVLGHESQSREAAAALAPLLRYERGLAYHLVFGLVNAADHHMTRFEADAAGVERKQNARAIERAISALRGFTGVFRFGVPSQLRCAARWARIRGDGGRAARLAAEAVKASTDLAMPYERGLSLLELSRTGGDAAGAAEGRRLLMDIGADVGDALALEGPSRAAGRLRG